MKTRKLFALALASLAFAACSNEDVVDNGGGGSVVSGEKGYISFAFNLPTTPSSRANDVFDDGIAPEYDVNDATLLLFAGNDEASSTFAGAYKLTLPDAENVGYNVTTRYSLVQQIEKPGTGNIYAMVILNGNGVIASSETEGVETWTLNGETLTNLTTFSSLYTTAKALDLNQIAKVTSETEGNFLMTNAPMFSAQGGTADPSNGKVQTLSVIDRDRIYGTEAEAKANPATEIYCERAVAKVTVKQGTNLSAADNDAITAYTLNGWTLDITSKESYLVRNVAPTTPWWGYKAANTSDYRFVGSIGLTNTASETWYRTYWGQDPTYALNLDASADVNTTYFNTTVGTVPASLTAIGGNAYCLENTFNVANQNQNQTTRAIVAAILTVNGAATGGSFFTLNDNKDVIYDSEDDIKTIVSTAYLNVPAIRKVLEDNLKDDEKFDNTNLTVTFTGEGKAGYWDVASITVNADANTLFQGDVIPAELGTTHSTYTAALAEVNGNYNIAFYEGGVSYYPVRIRHFDDKQTPWTETGKTDNAYPEPNAEQNYLGRYGVLRNNWYEIEVTGIRNIGSPVPDEVYGQDDPLDKWISVRINVLSWAKRSQSVEL